MKRLNYVNILQGTDSDVTFSRGNTLPLITRPRGMTHWCLQTGDDDWFFHPSHHHMHGFRATHQPSPWMHDYGHFTMMPQSGPAYLSRWRRNCLFRNPVFTPHLLSVELPRYRIECSLTPTERCSMLNITFPAEQQRRLIVQFYDNISGIRFPDSKGCLVFADTAANSGGVPEGFRMYIAMEFSVPVKHICSPAEADDSTDFISDAEQPVGCIELGSAAARQKVTVRIGTSFISHDQALLNIKQELGHTSFEEVQEEGAAAWSQVLDTYPQPQQMSYDETVLASALYRAHLFPRIFHEFDEKREMIHYSVYSGNIEPGPAYTDNGFWDTHRTVYPFLAMFYPDLLPEILEGWVNAYREGGWFPKWASPGYRACMIGTHLDAVFADACIRGITGFDLETAYQGLLKHATQPGDPAGHVGRVGLQEYISTGYVPADQYEHAASRTCDFAYGDFCIAQIAQHLGRTAEADMLIKRARNYRNVFDRQSGFIRGRNADGSWVAPFDPLDWGGPYVEGSAWQCGWAVPHDIPGLIELQGGPAPFIEKLDDMLAMPPDFNVGAYQGEIHEMSEMAAADFGQYAHSNQPVHHVLFMYAAAGAPEKARHWVERICQELYTRDAFPGDEDNGEMACWYLLALQGVYPMAPGRDIRLF